MKNIFWIHSNITFLISKEIISYLKLNEEDCILILFRGYILPNKIKAEKIFRIDESHELNDIEYEKVCYEWSKKLNFEYRLFIPQSGEKRIVALIKNKKCIEFNYIEEGLLAYNFSISSIKIKLEAFLKYLRLRKHIRMLDYSEKKLNACYTISDKAFLNSPSVTILPLKFNKNDESIIKNGSTIIVFDGLVSFGKVNLDHYIMLLRLIINDIKEKEIHEVYYKWHPEQLRAKNIKEKESILRLFEEVREISFIEIPSVIVLEEVFFLKEKLLIYIYISSLGFYANMAGQTVKSLSNRIGIELNENITEKWIQI